MARLSVEEYLATGMDHAGYLEPEVTSEDIYPPYLQAEVEETIEKLQQLQGFDTVTFGFMTDNHYATKFKHTHLIRLRRTLNGYRGISRVAHSDFLVLGGDHVTNGCKQYVKDCFRAFREELSGIPYLPVNGNHDDNSIWDRDFIHQQKAENHLSSEERYTLFFNGTPANGAIYPKENRGLYYYVNNPDQKIRYIFLDTQDFPEEFNEDGSLKYPGQHIYSYSQAQLDWLTSEALKFQEDGWVVVLFQHIPPYVYSEREKALSNLVCLRDILKARKNKESVSLEFGEGDFHRTVKVDYSHEPGCEIAGVFSGHVHKDWGYYYDGIPYITTTNAVMYSTANPERKDGDKTEVAFDMVTLNRKTRTLNVIRVGWGEDRTLTWEA